MNMSTVEKIKAIYAEVKSKRVCLKQGSKLYVVLISGSAYGEHAFDKADVPNVVKDNDRISAAYDVAVDELSAETVGRT